MVVVVEVILLGAGIFPPFNRTVVDWIKNTGVFRYVCRELVFNHLWTFIHFSFAETLVDKQLLIFKHCFPSRSVIDLWIFKQLPYLVIDLFVFKYCFPGDLAIGRFFIK